MSRFRGLWQASVNATKRALTWNLEDLVPPNEKYIFNFSSAEELKRWHLYSDSEYGAYNGDIHDLWKKKDWVLIDRFLEIIEKETEDET